MIPSELIAAIRSNWNKSFYIDRSGDVAIPTGREFLESLPRHRAVYHPYYTLVRESTQPAVRDFTIARPGLAERMVSPAALSRHLDDGYTLKVQRLQHFNRAIFKAVELLEAETGTFVTAYAFITPAQTQGLAYHRDASHVLVHQVEGTKNWHLWEPSSAPPPSAGLIEVPEGTLHEFTLEPGDFLYFPYGWVHAANTGTSGSAHVTFTMTPPTPDQLEGTYTTANGKISEPERLLQSCMSAIGVNR